MSAVRVKLEDFTKEYLDVLSRAKEEDAYFLEFSIINDDEDCSFMTVDIVNGDGSTTDMCSLDDIDVNYMYKFTDEYARIKEFEEMLIQKTVGETDDEEFWEKKHKRLEEMKKEFYDTVAINNER